MIVQLKSKSAQHFKAQLPEKIHVTFLTVKTFLSLAFPISFLFLLFTEKIFFFLFVNIR